MFCIVLNIIVMAMKYETAGKTYSEILVWCNLAFTFIFIFEALLKIFAYGRMYFNNGWN